MLFKKVIVTNGKGATSVRYPKCSEIRNPYPREITAMFNLVMHLWFLLLACHGWTLCFQMLL